MKSILHPMRVLARRIAGLLGWPGASTSPAATAAAPSTFPAWIEAQQWDGQPRLDTWLATALQREPSAYLARAGRYILIAHVARAFTPGCKFDHVPLLYGPSGTGKSSLPYTLVGPEYFSDEPFDPTRGADKPDLEGIYAYELTEIGALHRAEAETIKAFLAAREDLHRPTYGGAVQLRPRTCIVWATSNRTTLGRRFWPLHVPHRIDLDWLQSVRGQLFAEARMCWARGDGYQPTEAEEMTVFGPEIALTQGGAA